jgi:hypothetical protein
MGSGFSVQAKSDSAILTIGARVRYLIFLENDGMVSLTGRNSFKFQIKVVEVQLIYHAIFGFFKAELSLDLTNITTEFLK